MTNIGFFQPGHPAPGVGWAPNVRDWVIRNENTYGTLILDRVHFHGVSLGVLTNNAARPSYENITGQFFRKAFEFDQIFDLGKLEGLHAWTYWSENDYVLQYQQSTAGVTLLTLGRVDGMWFDRIFCFANYRAIYITTGTPTPGSSQVITVGGLYADFTGYGIVINAVGYPAHITVDSMFHLGQAWPSSPSNAIPDATAIYIVAGSNHNVQIGSLYSTLSYGAAIRVAGDHNQVWVSSPIIQQYSRGATGDGVVASADLTNIINFAMQPSYGIYGGGTAYLSTSGTVNMNVSTNHRIIPLAVNYPVTTGAIAGADITYTAEGSNANIGVAVYGKGTGTVILGNAANNLAFYGGSAAVKGTVTGACAGNTAIKNLLTYLAARGLLIDGTTA